MTQRKESHMHLVIKPHPRLGWQIVDENSGQTSDRRMSLRQAKQIKRDAERLVNLVLEEERKKR